MPKCSGCGHAFARWPELQKHIEENHCQGRAPLDTEQAKSFFVMVQDGDADIQALQQDGLSDALGREILQHCSFCRQWFPNDRYVKQHWSRVRRLESQQYLAAAKHWRRTQFGPIKDACTWCQGTPAPRADHRDTCPVLFQLSMVWAIQHDHATAQETTEDALELHIPDDSTLKKWELKCQICEVQVTARGLRKHMEKQHGEMWQKVRAQVDKLCSAWSKGLHSDICQFCNATYGKKQVHALSCHAITQTALEKVRAIAAPAESAGEHGPHSSASGSADAGSVWSDQRGKTNPGSTARGRRLPEAAQAQRKGRPGKRLDEQGQKITTSQQGDIREIIRGRGQQPGRDDAAALPCGSTAGGHAQHHKAAHQLGDIREDGGAHHHPRSGSRVPEVEGGDHQAEQSAGQFQSQDHAVLVSSQPAHGDIQELDGRSATAGQGSWMVHRTGTMGLPEMVTGKSGPRTGCDSGALADVGPDENCGGHEGPNHIGDSDSLSLQKTPDFKHAGGDGGATTVGCQLPEARGESILRETGVADGPGSAPARRITNSQRGVQEIRSSDETGRTDAVRTLVLHSCGRTYSVQRNLHRLAVTGSAA